jgi:gamma-butyrobetaine dioxygenase/trimethyllysine dioxygenase
MQDPKRVQAITVETVDDELRIQWQDGHTSRFHHYWLRENCMCEVCGDHAGGHRMLSLMDVPLDVHPDQVDLDSKNGLLHLHWPADDHTTSYRLSWLRGHCNSPEERFARKPEQMHWDSAIQEAPPTVTYDAFKSGSRELFANVKKYGFTIVSGLPAEEDYTETFANELGYLRETHYGKIFDLITKADAKVLAERPVPIRPHTDENFREVQSGIMILHCIQPSEDGGGKSVLTDGFRVAEQLRAEDPAAFQLLCDHPLSYVRVLEQDTLRGRGPVIHLDEFGEIVEFRLNERTMAPVEADPDLVGPIYRALHRLLEISYDPANQLHYLLQAGEAAIFDNHRVMHARTGFSGNRYIRLCNVHRDEFFSKLRGFATVP